MSPELLSQLSAPAAIGLSALTLAGGAALAQFDRPVACTWPAKGQALLRRLEAVKLYRRPGPARIAAGGVLLAALLGAGTLTAYAAEPSAPQQLVRAVVGVVGSGDKLGLSLKEAGAAPRTLKVGDDYKDGWTLTAVTPTTATLAKDGGSVEVGLNPAGVLAPAVAVAQAPTAVEIVGDRPLSQAEIDQAANERRSAQLAALRARQPPPTPAQLAIVEQNNAMLALVVAQNSYTRASALLDQAKALMAQAHTDDFTQALQGPGGALWAKAVYQLGGGDPAVWTYDYVKSIVDQGPPTLASVTQQSAAAPPAGNPAP